MNWREWINHIGQYKVGVHLMRTHAAGTFSMNMSWHGTPVIGYKGLDTQELLHPQTTVEVGDLLSAKQIISRLYEDEFFYQECSEQTLRRFKKYYSEEAWLEHWMFKKNYYKTPQSYTSIIHCSKNAILCSYALYTMRVTSVLSILDKIKPSQHTGADDLEMMGTYEYLGLTYAPIKKTLIYVRTEHNNRQTINRSEFKKTLSKVKDYVEYYRPNNFKTNPYKFSGIIKDNLDYKNYNELNNEFKTYHSLIKKNINKYL